MADWEKILSRGDVRDRRSFAPMMAGGLGLTGVVLFLLVTVLTDGQVQIPLEMLAGTPTQSEQTAEPDEFAGADTYEVFVSTVLGSTNDLWTEIFAENGKTYVPPTLVLFRTATPSACGGASSQVGPHYCPADKTIYLDETFFDELKNRFGAKGGDVAEAYIIAHEAGHHAQKLLGIMDMVTDKQQKNSASANELSVKMELQADCFAGLWANSIRDMGVLSPGEITEAMDAAAVVGDDRIQESTSGRINPENWTHGSSEARVGWFTKGYETGSLAACNTFN